MPTVRSSFKKIAEEQKKIGLQVREKTMGYILAALGFVVALAWNDAIKTFIEYVFPLNKNSIFIKFIYALVMTVLIVVATILLTKKTEQEKIENK
jgi:hypothetical protein